MSDDGKRKRRVEITVPKNYRDVNEKVWRELEEYLYTGFLYSPARVLGRSFVLKSVNHLELRNINMMRPAAGSPPQVRATFRAAMIAHSLFIIDGVNVLHNRADHFDKLMRVVSAIPAQIQDKIVENISYINARAMRLHPLVEPYCQDNRSRFHWMQLGSVPLHSSKITGIPGTDDLGMNHCQQTWTALNRLADIREEAEKQWAYAKFVGSCFNGKGVRQVDEQDKARKNRERQEFEENRMRVIRDYLNKSSGQRDESADLILPDGRKAIVEGRFRAESAEDLAEQLSAALSGEKDAHDIIIEQHFKRAMREKEERERGQQKFVPLPSRDGGSPVGGGSRHMGARVLPKDEAEAYIYRMKTITHGWDKIDPPDRGEGFDEKRVIDVDELKE